MRYLLSETGAAAVRALESRHGGSGLERRDVAQPGDLASTFAVELRTLSNQRWIRVYIPNRSGAVKVDGESFVPVIGIVNGWNNIAVFGGVQTIVYLEPFDGGTTRTWSIVARTSQLTPTGSQLVLPTMMIARIDADGVVHQLHLGALVFTTHYLVRGTGYKSKLLTRLGNLVAEIDETPGVPSTTGDVAFAGNVTVAGEIDASGGISNATGIRIGGSLYVPTRISTGDTVLAKQ